VVFSITPPLPPRGPIKISTYSFRNQLQSEDLVIENAKILIAHGAKMDSHEILYFAAERYSTRVLEFLLDQEGAQINPPNQTSPFASAMFQYSMVVSSIWRDKTVEVPRLRANVDFLLSRGADRNHIVGGTPWWHGNFNTSQIEGLRYVLELGEFFFPPPPNKQKTTNH